MRGYANERGLPPLAEGSFPRRRDVRSVPLVSRHDDVRRVETGRARMQAARRALDGVGGLGWSVIGFLMGAVFWHFVGFWTFVSGVVLAGHPSDTIDRSRVEGPRIAASRTAGASQDAPLAVAWCTSLQLDRATGAISSGACGQGFAPSSGRSVKPREDRAAMANGGAWAAPDTPARALGPRRP